MGLLASLRSLYDLDTLDTRFTNSSSVPYQTVIDARSDPATKNTAAIRQRTKAQPPKWQTPEFYLYYMVIALAVPYMFWVAYSVSRPSDPRYDNYRRYLTNGWVPGRKIDNSDAQYFTFRLNLPYIAALLVFHPVLRQLWNSLVPIPENHISGAKRFRQRVSFDAVFAILFLVVLHGTSAAKILIILSINYQLATKLPRSSVPAATWVWNIGVLFANEMTTGFPFSMVLGSWSPALVETGRWLDGYSGLMPRWQILFNFTILRLISFNLDYYWSVDKRPGDGLEVASAPDSPALLPTSANRLKKKQLDPRNLSERDRVSIPAAPHLFTFRNYLAYAIYAPLYLAGPILTFNDYISQCHYRSASIETSRTVRYGIRFVLVLLCMELVLHFDYVGAISKARPMWDTYTPAQLAMLSFFNLHIIWLKLLLPWRLFRLWSLVDGIDPPENMVRCVSNNYSAQLFWRGWHRSYNRWLIRYIYVPLGGSSFRSWKGIARSIVTYLVSFTFVALWHDIKLRLLIWGWLIVLFMLPEFAATALFPKRRFEGRETQYRMLCCAGAVVNVLMMMSANLVGFAFGLDGLETIVRAMLRDWSGIFFLTTACGCLFVGIQVMFEIRETEKRKGHNVRC